MKTQNAAGYFAEISTLNSAHYSGNHIRIKATKNSTLSSLLIGIPRLFSRLLDSVLYLIDFTTDDEKNLHASSRRPIRRKLKCSNY
jgi:hypothetical protein